MRHDPTPPPPVELEDSETGRQVSCSTIRYGGMPVTSRMLPATHRIITDECRKEHGDDAALMLAQRSVEKAYRNALRGWRQQGREPDIHIIVSVSIPEEAKDGEDDIHQVEQGG